MRLINYFKSLIPWFGAGYRLKIMLYKREFYRKHKLWFLASCLRAKMIKRYSCDIHQKAVVSPKINIMHTIGIVIGEGCVIEEDVTIYQGVCVGRAKINDNNYPVIKKRCVLYANSAILGGVVLEEGCVVGFGSLVKCNCPRKSIMVGIPARRIGNHD